ncbi:GNAT family N-acetyltransferase [Phycicoccus sp. 3266]|uniref:GNAT family N-acetyltransferase n=1 Tax=Phycicoccus sp. 3266 TaxID=2817751 RepID=UPI0028553370|nr:GNAT family N-acetyltransferase [Phycicoccus sp. 3266]MDR6863590.1 ribosomal protein S18 acetylase RimI-like enzyme [Phycicoccus sp. 3266]
MADDGGPAEAPPEGTSGPVRGYTPRDRAALYQVCVRTGAEGEDASDLYAVPRLLPEVYLGAYLEFEPELASVLDDGAGAEGYVVGTLDTRAFEARCEREWWPALRSAHPEGSVPEGTADARLVHLLHEPPVAPAHVVAQHPSHLHVDLLPRWQGGGWGRVLLERLFAQLAAAGSPGVHLGVGTANERAVRFYGRLGFEVLDDTFPGALFLGRRLP